MIASSATVTVQFGRSSSPPESVPHRPVGLAAEQPDTAQSDHPLQRAAQGHVTTLCPETWAGPLALA